MFSGETSLKLIQLLAIRGVYLYHACQYQDFCSYLKIGGIPSRHKLEQNNLSVTPFTTDNVDKENNVWDKVFLNLEDFGRTFARGKGAVPNVYGPILFRFQPAAFAEATDIAICLRSAGARGFSREKESLKSIEQVDKLFYNSSDHSSGAAYLKFKDGLQKTFGSAAQSVEISCTLPHGVLSFGKLAEIVVDPYSFGDYELIDLVMQKTTETKLPVTVLRRNPPQIDVELYNKLRRVAEQKNFSPAFLTIATSSEHLRNWAHTIAQKGGLLEKNYGRYLQYLYQGTVRPVKAELDELRLQETTNTPWRQYAINRHDFEDYEDEYADVDYFMSEETVLSFEHDDQMSDLLEEREAYIISWAESHDGGWYYGDDDDYDDFQDLIR